eukprot:CAMPEP_0114229850 /NCGR_PEP_ID=MMETSP0058-20121206/3141_1 /TAXON_ID=36894 /ORGANISM="Pyramimonas parkeae, CCMP726" /LENGTH=334 /DNA_ID=CAMNT_0001340981 /DNA_START=149 /DNA_END=1153 /DNA_ORIENTATION=-
MTKPYGRVSRIRVMLCLISSMCFLDPRTTLASARLFDSLTGSTPHKLVQCSTTKGNVVVQMRSDWAPLGAARFVDLVERGFFTDVALFRKNPWIVQFGAMKQPETGERAQFDKLPSIPDDPQTDCGGACTKGHLFDGALSFAGGGENSRSTQAFFVHNLADQPIGHSSWEVPIGNITQGLDVVRSLFGGYGDEVDQVKIFENGNDWVRQTYPELDFIISCYIKQAKSATLTNNKDLHSHDGSSTRMTKRPRGASSNNDSFEARVYGSESSRRYEEWQNFLHDLYRPGPFVVGMIDGFLMGVLVGAGYVYRMYVMGGDPTVEKERKGSKGLLRMD